MDFYNIFISGYNIKFLYNKTSLNLYIEEINSKGKNKIKFTDIHLSLESHLRKNISNFIDLINQIKDKKIQIIATLNEDKPNNKFIELKFKTINMDKEKIIISKKIYPLNVEYYLTTGPCKKNISSKPFLSYIIKEKYNLEDILDLVDKEDILNIYKIDEIKYFNEDKKVFMGLKNSNNFLNIRKKLILQFHIGKRKDLFLTNLKWMNKYINEEIIKLKKKFIKYSDTKQQYDLIYLFASPIITDENYNESESPISYIEELRIIAELMQMKRKRYKCKIQCADENLFRDVLIKNKTKILHIAAHGLYDGTYSLNLENLKKNGQNQILNIDKLKSILNLCKKNISQLDLVILLTCYSEDFADLFLECGAKNVIYISKKTEVIDRISILFVKFFYQNLIEGKSIKNSYINAMKKMKLDKEIISINSNSCCCHHYHKPDCIMNIDLLKDKIHNSIHVMKKEKCHCDYEQPHHHDKNCKYFNELKNRLINEDLKDIEEGDKNIICCCDKSIEHNEILKILYKSKEDIYGNITPFKYNYNGKIELNSSIKLYFDKNKFDFIIGRKSLIARIFNNIINKGKFSILFGETGLAKIYFAESSCVYLFERNIINTYDIFRINSEFDFECMKRKIIENTKNIEIDLYKKKDIKIIKFGICKNGNPYKYINDIYKLFFNNNDKLYFIFIFDINEENDETEIKEVQKSEIFIKEIKNYITNDINIKLDENLFYAGLNEDNALMFLNHLLKGKNIRLNEKNKRDLLKNKAKYKPRKIKNLSELILQGETVENINNMTELQISNINIINKSTYVLYYLLSNMPSGLPDCFLQLIFNDYDCIRDYNNLIVKSPMNWNIINKDKNFNENFNNKEYMESCYVYLFETLKIYSKLLSYSINKNRERIIYKGGNIHLVFNSYSERKIWKSKIPITFGKSLGKIILSQDYNINNHINNIINVIEIIINNFEFFNNNDKIKEEMITYLEEILLLFPSYFFLKQDNIKYINKSISLCEKLILKKFENNFKTKKEEFLKKQLLLYLYSIDESKNEILQKKYVFEMEEDLQIELIVLKEIRKKEKNIKKLLLLFEKNISEEMKLFLYREIAIFYFLNEGYDNCFEYLDKILNYKNINKIFRNRIIIDSCYVLRKQILDKKIIKIKETKEKVNINEKKYELVKNNINKLNEIMENPSLYKIYYEAYNLKNESFNLLEPDIVMLNSNPLKNLSNEGCPLNNQYYILKELKKSLDYHIRIKSYLLNEKNLNQALDERGEILIIQSDDFTLNGDIICESEKGKSYIFQKGKIIELIKKKIIKYKLIILCFPKSSIFKEYIDKYINTVNNNYWITFDFFDDSKVNNQIQELNKISIKFLIDFIKNTVDNIYYRDIESIFSTTKSQYFTQFNEIKCNIFLIKGKNNNTKIEYKNKKTEKEIFSYDNNFIALNNIEINFNIELKDYSAKIYDLIARFKIENKLIFNCDKNNKKFHLKICFEIMKFFYRHKTFCELYYIDIMKEGKFLLKSIIRKLNKIKDVENEDEDDEENIEQKKVCLILINNCTWKDIIDINIYSILQCNSSFIIIYDKEKYINDENKNELIFNNIIEQEQSYIENVPLEKSIELNNIFKIPVRQKEDEKNLINIMFNYNGSKIVLMVKKSMKISELLKLYMRKVDIPESNINNLLFIIDEKKNIENSDEPISKIINTLNPIIKVVEKK